MHAVQHGATSTPRTEEDNKRKIPLSTQWRNTLSGVLKHRSRNGNTKSKKVQPKPQVNVSSIVPIKNPLLEKYDPIKLLNHPDLAVCKNANETSDNDKAANTTKPVPTLRDLRIQDDQANRSSDPKQAKSNEMPPPSVPSSWPSRNTQLSAEAKSTKLSASETPKSSKSDGFLIRANRNCLPYFEPKISLGKPTELKKVTFSNISSVKISRSALRIRTIALHRRALRRAMQIDKTNKTQTSKPKAQTAENSKSSANVSGKTKHQAKKVLTHSRFRNNRRHVMKITPNPIILNTIDLLRHQRLLRSRIEHFDNEGVVYKLEALPVMKQPIPKGQLTVSNIPLTKPQTKEIIQKRLLILLAHGGFTHVRHQPLEVLADVMEQFYTKLARRLKEVKHMELSGCDHEFPDTLERVLVEMGIGGVRGAEKYYQNNVLDYHKRVHTSCLSLREAYAQKIKQKVATSVIASSSNSSTAATSLASSSGNRVIAEIISGLEKTSHVITPTVDDEIVPANPPTQEEYFSLPPTKHVVRSDLPSVSLVKSKSSTQTLSHIPTSATVTYSVQLQPSLVRHHQPPSTVTVTAQVTKGNSRYSTTLTDSSSSSNLRKPPSTSTGEPSINLSHLSSKTVTSSLITNKSTGPLHVSNNLVSVNLKSLNNNVDIDGFVPITPPSTASSKTVTSEVSSESKAKLKETLQSRNLLRLNFEQVPSSGDSTVLLSSSSSTFSSPGGQSSSSSPQPRGQTARIKL